jgi:tRNA 2-thiouridine synthesizing protein A
VTSPHTRSLDESSVQPGPVVLDARGLRCPLPVIRLARLAQQHLPGSLLTAWATDPAAEHDIPAWARMRGHGIVSIERATGAGDEYLAITVRLGADSQNPR